jgi:3-hydroxyisobutyrate dehydrogenase
MTIRIAVVGLGRMGAAMAGRLAAEGFEVTGFDVRPDAAAGLAGIGVHVAPDLPSLWPAADLVLLSLPLPEHVEQVLTGTDGFVGSAAAGVRVVDTSTSDPEVTRRLAARLAEAGYGLVDAPVSGGPAGAAAGTLAMMLGGTAEDIAAVRPVLDALGDKLSHVGPSGAGHTAKLVNNLLCAAQILLAGEALRLGATTGASMEALAGAVSGASGRSGVTEVNVPRWILSESFDSGFTLALMEKDLALAARLAERSGLSLPLIEAVVARWRAVRAAHGDDADFNRAFFGDET